MTPTPRDLTGPEPFASACREDARDARTEALVSVGLLLAALLALVLAETVIHPPPSLLVGYEWLVLCAVVVFGPHALKLHPTA